ncbi:hypothetical protein ACET3Z_028248 [Daucus carota]
MVVESLASTYHGCAAVVDAVLVLEDQTAAPTPVTYVIATHVLVAQYRSVQVALVALVAQIPAGHAAAGRAPV